VPATYELRTYQLILGYNPVPELRAAFCEGCVLRDVHVAAQAIEQTRADTPPALVRKSLPSKVAADKEGQLVLMCYSDVGCAAGANPVLFWPGLLLFAGT
jgi:hypothetical protein